MGHTETFLLGHIHQLEQAGVDIPDNWFWYKSRVGETLDLTNEIVQELHALHEKALEKPNVRTLLEELLYMLELMIQSGPRSGEDQAEKKRIVADLIDKTTKLLEQEVEPATRQGTGPRKEFGRMEVANILTEGGAYSQLGEIKKGIYKPGKEFFDSVNLSEFLKNLRELTGRGGKIALQYWSKSQIDAKEGAKRETFNEASIYWLSKQLQDRGVEFTLTQEIREASDSYVGTDDEGKDLTFYDVFPGTRIIDIPAQPRFSHTLMEQDLVNHLIEEWGLDLESTADPIRPSVFKERFISDEDIPDLLPERGVPVATAMRKQDLIVQNYSLVDERKKEEIEGLIKEKVKEVNSAIAYIRKTVNKPLSNPEIIISSEFAAYWVFKAQTA